MELGDNASEPNSATNPPQTADQPQNVNLLPGPQPTSYSDPCCRQKVSVEVCLWHQLNTLISNPAYLEYDQIVADLPRMRHLAKLDCSRLASGCIVNSTQWHLLKADLERAIIHPHN